MVPVEEALRSGELLLNTEPALVEETVRSVSIVEPALVSLFTLLPIIFMRNFINILPYIIDSFTRARGSSDLEGSVRVSRDRNLIAMIFIIPFILLLYFYRIYDPSFLSGMGDNMRLLLIGAIFIAYLLLRRLLVVIFAPRRVNDNYAMAEKAAYTFFILAGMLVLPTFGILYLLGVNDLTIKTVALAEISFVYLVFLLRKSQILSTFCSPLTVFLYLCALEFLPTGLYVASALLL